MKAILKKISEYLLCIFILMSFMVMSSCRKEAIITKTSGVWSISKVQYVQYVDNTQVLDSTIAATGYIDMMETTGLDYSLRYRVDFISSILPQNGDRGDWKVSETNEKILSFHFYGGGGTDIFVTRSKKFGKTEEWSYVRYNVGATTVIQRETITVHKDH